MNLDFRIFVIFDDPIYDKDRFLYIFKLWTKNFVQISVVTHGSLRYLGDLPFDFTSGTCGTFNMNGIPRILLCFSKGNSGVIGIDVPSDDEIKKCRILTRSNIELLRDITNFKGIARRNKHLLSVLTHIGNIIFDHLWRHTWQLVDDVICSG